MAAQKAPDTLVEPNDAHPMRVVLYCADNVDGTLRPLRVNASGELEMTAEIASATFAPANQYTEDAAAPANPVGNAIMLVREDARAGSLTTTDNDNVALRGNNKGEAYFKDTDAAALLAAATPAGTNAIGFTTVPVTITRTVTRPSDTNPYIANDAWSTSTSAPTVGGNVLTGAGRASGKSGRITDAIITSSADPATLLQGELWVFDTTVTEVNDNAAFALSDADVLKLVVVIPFSLVTTVAGSGTNSAAVISGINTVFTCVGSANLIFLIKVKSAYTPISGEVLQVRLKIEQLD